MGLVGVGAAVMVDVEAVEVVVSRLKKFNENSVFCVWCPYIEVKKKKTKGIK